MRPFETADVAFLETLKARHEALQAELTAAERTADAQHAAKIAAELTGDGGQGVCRASSICRPARGVHGGAPTALVAAARRIGAAGHARTYAPRHARQHLPPT